MRHLALFPELGWFRMWVSRVIERFRIMTGGVANLRVDEHVDSVARGQAPPRSWNSGCGPEASRQAVRTADLAAAPKLWISLDLIAQRKTRGILCSRDAPLAWSKAHLHQITCNKCNAQFP